MVVLFAVPLQDEPLELAGIPGSEWATAPFNPLANVTQEGEG